MSIQKDARQGLESETQQQPGGSLRSTASHPVHQTELGGRLASWLIGACCGLLLVAEVRAADDADRRSREEYFERHVRPVLVDRCLKCHGEDKAESDLRVDTRDGVIAGGLRGAAIVPSKVGRSLLIEAVHRRGELKMPPAKPLTRAEVKALERWVRDGAVWPTARPVLRQGDKPPQRHWAFRPIVKPPIPNVTSERLRNSVDHFVAAKLKTHDLTPAREADPRTLVRRLYFDLIGLPPTAGDVESFADAGPSAYEALVDRLLDRPEYGERWARHWLDVARYSDTTGYAEGAQRRYPFAWTYRDYVVRSLNADVPFNEFVVEQLAADQLKLDEADRWKLAAMGFLTLGPRFNYVRHEIIDDRIDVVTRGLLGITVSCARCHDHKYDPIVAEDYYGLYGVFASSHEPLYADLPRIGDSRGDFSRYREFRRKVAAQTREFERFHARVHRTAQHEMRSLVGDYLRYVVQMMPEHRTVSQPSYDTDRGHIRGPTPYGPGAIVRWQNYLARRGPDDPVFGPWNRLAELPSDAFTLRASDVIEQPGDVNRLVSQALKAANPQQMLDVATAYGELLEGTYASWRELQATDPSAERLVDPVEEQLRLVLYADDSPIAMNEDEAHDCYTDGEFNEFMAMKRELDSLFVEYADVAAPRAMVMFDRAVPEEPRLFSRGKSTQPEQWVERRYLRALSSTDAPPFTRGSGRLELAQAIVAPDNPLTARVIVNRVWQWHFGRGLVDTPSDFGTRAAPPSHPELLDWLAADFVEHGWSLKRLHKQIVMSATYRQTSLSEQHAATDPENRYLWRMNRRRLDFEPLRDSLLAIAGRLDNTHGGPPTDELDSPRRSLYLLVNRDDPAGVFGTFDFPSADISIAKRPETTVPQQALFLMNSPFTARVVEQVVEIMADEVTVDDDTARIDWLYRRILGRSPEKVEARISREVLTSAANQHAGSRDLAHLLLMSNEFMFVD